MVLVLSYGFTLFQGSFMRKDIGLKGHFRLMEIRVQL